MADKDTKKDGPGFQTAKARYGSRGREPTEIGSDVGLATVENLSGLGLNNGQIAAILGVSSQTFYNHLKKDPRVKDALERGKAKAVAKVSQTAFEMATSGRSSEMTKFFLKCQGDWKEKTEINLKATVEHAPQMTHQQKLLAQLSDEELKAFESILEKQKLIEASEEDEIIDVKAEGGADGSNGGTNAGADQTGES